MSGDAVQQARRKAPRLQTDMLARVRCRDSAADGRLLNLSASGAFLTLDESAMLPPIGSGLTMEFRLPIGLWIHAVCSIRWVREQESAEGPRGCGVEFTTLQGGTQEALQDFLDSPADDALELTARVRDKYRLIIEADAVALSLGGALGSVETMLLRVETLRQLRLQPKGELFCFVDASRFNTSPAAALEQLEELFRALVDWGIKLAVLVEPAGLPGTQLRRVLRQAGIADVLLSFSTEAEARQFWKENRGTMHV